MKVKCCSVNASDIMICHGLYEIAPKLPFIPGYEVSGEILELGSKAAEGLKVGDKIVGLNKDLFSGFSEECILQSLVCMPFCLFSGTPTVSYCMTCYTFVCVLPGMCFFDVLAIFNVKECFSYN